MKILKLEEPPNGPFTIIRGDGKLEGMVLTKVAAHMDTGEVIPLFKSSEHEGLFKRVYVPWDVEIDGMFR
jgi:hypothetical protein